MNVLSIDPGSSGFGWAHWPDTTVQPKSCGVFYPVRTKIAKANAFQENLKVTGEAFTELLEETNPKIVVCERPFIATTGSAYAVAASGDVLKLAMSVGVMLEACRTHEVKLTFMEVRDWKGQLDDPIVIQRIKRQMPGWKSLSKGLRSHAWDAVGIGLVYFHGRLG